MAGNLPTGTRRVGSIRPLRHELSAWLDDQHVVPAVRDAVVLSVWEATVNAVEHGSSTAQDPVSVRVVVESRTLVADVSDVGIWRQGPPDPTRGNGLPLMRARWTRSRSGPAGGARR